MGSLIACPATDSCVAVTKSGQVSRFDGATWSAARPVPTVAPVASITCPSSAFCLAVDGNGVVFRFDRATWTTVWAVDPGAPQYAVSSLSCVSATLCVAVGYELNYYDLPATTTYDGTGWAGLTPTPSGIGPDLLSCPTATFCLGTNQPGEVVIGRR
ncbi:hypothetical protein SAMN04515671_0998 [Nakamurella panacisegetis]|uniref:Uncharacterized protein n=1 Tax=Nakamurella panacisegetis TaxID=1090615 RepID=A0A1H0JR20_9ACTN|nr:hypothetical protein [Nakamurella panacisegetis]SDO45861.1 hypothetical protein SAMN04515671_0998 [Nakamurella panacisegetis]